VEMKEWIGEKADEWTGCIKAIAKVAPLFPQMAYAGIQKSLQQEWQFVQRVIDGIGGEFSEVEAALTEVFLPALFEKTMPTGSHLQKVTALPVKVSGLSIPNAEHSGMKIFLTSMDCCSFLANVIMGRATWSHLDHKVTLKQTREAAQSSSITDAEITRTELMGEEHMSKKMHTLSGLEVRQMGSSQSCQM
jgi:hypothetical protein